MSSNSLKGKKRVTSYTKYQLTGFIFFYRKQKVRRKDSKSLFILIKSTQSSHIPPVAETDGKNNAQFYNTYLKVKKLHKK